MKIWFDNFLHSPWAIPVVLAFFAVVFVLVWILKRKSIPQTVEDYICENLNKCKDSFSTLTFLYKFAKEQDVKIHNIVFNDAGYLLVEMDEEKCEFEKKGNDWFVKE